MASAVGGLSVIRSETVSQILFFLIFSAIWAIADHYIAPPIARLIALVRGGGPNRSAENHGNEGVKDGAGNGGLDDQQAQVLARFEAVNLGIAEGLVGIGLGFITGLLRGHLVLAVSFTTSAWSWIATFCLIIASLVGAAVHQILLLILNQLALA